MRFPQSFRIGKIQKNQMAEVMTKLNLKKTQFYELAITLTHNHLPTLEKEKELCVSTSRL